MNPSGRILVVGKSKKYLDFLTEFLSKHSFTFRIASSISETANQLISSNNFEVTLVIQDSIDTYILDFIHNIKTFNPQMGIILLSRFENPNSAIKLIKKGAVDYITDPENLVHLYSAIRNELKKKDLDQKNAAYLKKIQKMKLEQQKNLRKTLDLEEIYDTTIENLMTALDLRDVETFGHSRTVAKYSLVLAQILGIKDKIFLDSIRKGSLLHDVGKIAIPDAILKKPGPLSDLEWEKIRLHPSLGYGLVKEIKLLKKVGNIILYHHERYDGLGYPKQLKKDKIPAEARIFALADSLDAITSHRPYREQRSFEVARKEIQQNSGTQFDPQIVEAFSSFELSKWEKIRFESTKLIPSMEDMAMLHHL